MWRMKVTAVTLVVLGALMFGAVVAYAGWGWNAKVNIEGTMVRTAWTAQHNHSGASDLFTKITVTVPTGVDAKVIETAKNESINLRHSDELACTESGIETIVTYVVEHSGNANVKDRVRVVVSELETHRRLAAASGVLGEEISVNVMIAGECNG